MLYLLIFNKLLVITMNCLSKIRLTLRCISNRLRMVHFEVFASAPAIVPLAFQLTKVFSGSGLVVMPITINYLVNLKSLAEKHNPLNYI